MSKINDKIRLEQRIKEQCFEPESILDYLRERRFDSAKCTKFLETVEQYYEAIKGTPDINRETAGYLHVFQDQLLGALQHYESFDGVTGTRKQLQSAFNEAWELINKIYFSD